MEIASQVKWRIQEALEASNLFGIPANDLSITETKAEFEGDFTLILFPFVKSQRKSPEILGNQLGQLLLERFPQLFSKFNVIKGFLNLTIADAVWIAFLQNEWTNDQFGKKQRTGKKVMVEYSSPNTNKPLHLGHLRNNFLGWSLAALYEACGYDVVKTCIANDRGIHICKSMVAWKMFSGGSTPESTGIKGDHFVGDYYVLFGVELKKQVEAGVAAGLTKEAAEKEAPLMKSAQQMLIDWENGDPDVLDLWRRM